MSERKTRIDKGVPRGPRTTQRKEFLRWFVTLSQEERCALRDDMDLVEEVIDLQRPDSSTPK